MKLPNAHLAIVDREKIVGYLLDPFHLDGASKAEFFSKFGFGVESWTDLAGALIKQGRENEITRTKLSFFGMRYEVDGAIAAPTGLKPRIRTVWQIDHGGVAPRLITAHPLGGTTMIKEHDRIVLTQDLSEERLEAGDVGTVIHVHQGGAGYEVEFMTLPGQTIAIATLLPSQVRAVARRDLAHVREIPTV